MRMCTNVYVCVCTNVYVYVKANLSANVNVYMCINVYFCVLLFLVVSRYNSLCMTKFIDLLICNDQCQKLRHLRKQW